MAEKKSERLRKLTKIQRHKEKMAETDLAYIISEQRHVADSVTSVINALGSMNPLHSVFSPHYVRRLSSLDETHKKLNLHRDMQERKMLTERIKAERLEEKIDNVMSDEDRELEEENMQDLLDLLEASKNSSPR